MTDAAPPALAADFLRFTFPWPPRELHPNGRSPNVFQHGRFFKAFKGECYWQACGQGAVKHRTRLAPEGPIAISVTFHPPINRYRDEDGCLSSAKALLDALAEALKVNDHRFRVTHRIGALDRPFGSVCVDVGVRASGATIDPKET